MTAKLSQSALAGQAAASSIRWRARQIYGDSASPAAEAAIVQFASWALSHFRYTAGFERALLDSLGAKWVDGEAGGRRLVIWHDPK
jgi:hypothetical protein